MASLISFIPASITPEEAKQAGLSGQEASYLQKNGAELLSRLFHLAIQSDQPKKKADYIVRSERGIYDWTKKVIVHLRVKEDGTVTLGISSPLAEGSYKYVRKMVRFSAHIKF